MRERLPEELNTYPLHFSKLQYREMGMGTMLTHLFPSKEEIQYEGLTTMEANLGTSSLKHYNWELLGSNTFAIAINIFKEYKGVFARTYHDLNGVLRELLEH